MAGGNQYASVTDVGQDRELNEDNHGQFELDGGEILLVVCDGMGGHEGGEVASQIAVEAIGQIFHNSRSDDPREKLANGFRVANQRILAEAERSGSEGMGTTAVAVHVDGNRFVTAHVGDSRVYQIRDGEVVWRTTDHTRVQKMVDKGILTEEEAKVHPDANVVTRALGYRETADGEPIEADVSAKPLTLREGDTLVLCSDGLYDGVTDDEIADSVTGVSVEDAAQRLVDFANERGGHDNITVTVIRHGATSARAVAAAATETRGSQRITDLEEGAGKERTTALDDGEAASKKRPAPKPAKEPPAEDSEPDRRRVAAILLIVAALAIVGLVVFLLFGRGGDDDSGTSGAPSTTTPSPAGGATTPSTHPATAPADGTGGTTTPASGDGDAPPLPENPITGGGKKPKTGGTTAPTLAPPDDPNQPAPQGGTPPTGKQPTGKQPTGKQPTGKQPTGGGLFDRGKVNPTKPPATTKPANKTKPPADPDVKELQ